MSSPDTRPGFDSEVRLREALATKGSARVVLVSASMDPLLPVGAEATVEPCKFDELKRFDLVLFRSENIVVCHAVWGRSTLLNLRGEPTLMTWGLMSPSADDPVSADDVLARVVSHRLTPFQVAWAISVRLFSRFVTSTFFMLALLISGALLRFSGLKSMPLNMNGTSFDLGLVFVFCSMLGVFAFTSLQARATSVRGRVMALCLALSPLSIAIAHESVPWVAIEAMTVFYIVAIWNYIQGERARLRNLMFITIVIAMVLKFEPSHFAWRLRSPLVWHLHEWETVLEPLVIFAAVTLVAGLYRLIFRLSIKAPAKI